MAVTVAVCDRASVGKVTDTPVLAARHRTLFKPERPVRSEHQCIPILGSNAFYLQFTCKKR